MPSVKRPTAAKPVEIKKIDPSQRHTCPYCPYASSKTTNLDAHVLRGHTTPKAFKCPSCSYSAINERYLREHLKLHDNSNGMPQNAVALTSVKTVPKTPQKQKLPVKGNQSSVFKTPGRHSCPHCPYVSDRRSVIDKHVLAYHTTHNAFQCPSCTFSSDLLKTLLAHRKLHSGGKPQNGVSSKRKKNRNRFACPHCPHTAQSTARVDHHVLTYHTTSNAFKCSSCTFSSTWLRLLIEHRKLHFNRKPQNAVALTRAKAVQKTPLKQQISKGIRSSVFKTPRNRHLCPSCPYAAYTRARLENHVLTGHTASNAFKCSSCTFSAATQYLLLEHEKLHDSSNGQPQNAVASTSSIDRSQRHTCPHCPYANDQASKISNHVLNNHTVAKPFKCDSCTYSAAAARSLSEHRKLHNIVKGKAQNGVVLTRAKPLLKTPQKQQPLTKGNQSSVFKTPGNRRHSCPHCPYANDRLCRVNDHVLDHHTTRKAFKCPSCTFSADAQRFLTEHLKWHDISGGNAQKGATLSIVKQVPKTPQKQQLSAKGNSSVSKTVRKSVMFKIPQSQLKRSSAKGDQSSFLKKNRAHTCPYCPYAAQTAGRVLDHVRENHTTAHAFKCSHCSFSSDTQRCLTEHRKWHDGPDGNGQNGGTLAIAKPVPQTPQKQQPSATGNRSSVSPAAPATPQLLPATDEPSMREARSLSPFAFFARPKEEPVDEVQPIPEGTAEERHQVAMARMKETTKRVKAEIAGYGWPSANVKEEAMDDAAIGEEPIDNADALLAVKVEEEDMQDGDNVARIDDSAEAQEGDGEQMMMDEYANGDGENEERFEEDPMEDRENYDPSAYAAENH